MLRSVKLLFDVQILSAKHGLMAQSYLWKKKYKKIFIDKSGSLQNNVWHVSSYEYSTI